MPTSIAMLLLVIGGMSPTGAGYREASQSIETYFRSHVHDYHMYMAACSAPSSQLQAVFMNDKEMHPSPDVAKSMAFMLCTWYRNEVAGQN